MRHALLILALAVTVFACDDDTKPLDDDPPSKPTTRSKLERPNTLPRPPSGGLPDELRPPR
jgi:hypothetical protein